MTSPDIRMSVAARTAHGVTSAVPDEHPMDDFVSPELPSPAPSYFPPRSAPTLPSPIAPSVTLSIPSPADARPPSSVSFASSQTLNGRESLQSPTTEDDTVLGGPLTADPESIVAGPDRPTEHAASAVPTPRRRVYMAPSPVTHFTEGERSRYRRQPVRDEDGFTMIPRLSELPLRDKPGGRWESFIHPEGNRYFRYKNFFTNEDLYDRSENYGKLYYVEHTMERIMDELSQCPSICLDDIEIAIKIMIDEEGDELGCHYFANTRTQEVFYLDEVEEGFFYPQYGMKILSRDHLKRAAESLYWEHVFMFPHRRKLPVTEYQGLQADLVWYLLDRETSVASTSPYTVDELYRFQAIVKDLVTDGQQDMLPQHMAAFARLKAVLSMASFRRYHGEYCAQLDSDLSQFGEYPEPRTLFKIVAWLFFSTPRTYLDCVRRAWVDQVVNHQHWRRLVSELQEDWTASITPATVILTTNVGFLAIQSVDLNGSPNSPIPDRSVAQILAYMSTVLSIGNIVACTILARQHRPNAHSYATQAAEYFAIRAPGHRGMEMLAIIYAIPTTFFLWALLTFFLAIGWVCFDNTSAITRCMVGFTVVLSALMLGGIIQNGNWQIQTPVEAFRERVDRTKELVMTAKRVPRKLSKKLRRLSTDAATVLKRKTRSLSGPRPGESFGVRPLATTRPSLSDVLRPRWAPRSFSRTLLPM
ncbi:hypothetical protein OH76DRAFT_1406204 [Lentinus brumalis]|uniref:WW domain-containing protein n=1 Tax=Lentinus brumalis TaxID=2498619 RepID=A0A371D459_9APHY|nr:hypothetical protein OH76DRAFT_1406204 [Polyporus brumalis]